MNSIFRHHAPSYWDKGLCVVPVEPGEKRPAKQIRGWQGYCNEPPRPDVRRQWCDLYQHAGIGLLLNTPVTPGHHLVAIDVDDDAYVRLTKVILRECPSGKRGAKGATFFALARKGEVRSTTIADHTKATKIDILANGRMSVLPPSLHPTGTAYAWLGTPLLDCPMERLPCFDNRSLSLLKLVVGSEHAATLLNGSGTHSAGVALTAALVAFGCADAEIEKIIVSLLPDDYAGNSLEELPGWIKSARQKGFGSVGRLPVDEELANLVQDKLGLVVFIPGEGFRQYRDGSWPLVSDRDIDRLAKSLLLPRLGPKQQVRTYLQGVRHCLELNVEKRDFGAGTETRIGLLNGAFDLATGKLEPHSPDHELRFRLDIPYEPTAQCPNYVQQLSQTFAGDEQAMALFDEFAGLTLVPDMRFQRALYLLGAAGSGKSTLLRVLESMHDPEGVTVTSLDKIDHERYLTNLATKLVCISYDVQTNRPVFGEAFVRITGGDPVAIRKLYHEVEGRVTPTVRFVGSMNFDIPKTVAASDALRRRLIFLPCGAKVEQPDPDRFKTLQEERPGILVRWMTAVQRLYARGQFDVPEESLNEVIDYTTSQDPVELFAKEKLEANPDGKALISAITREYNWWADEHEERRLASNALGRKLRSLGFKGAFTSVCEGEDRRTCRVIHVKSHRTPTPVSRPRTTPVTEPRPATRSRR